MSESQEIKALLMGQAVADERHKTTQATLAKLGDGVERIEGAVTGLSGAFQLQAQEMRSAIERASEQAARAEEGAIKAQQDTKEIDRRVDVLEQAPRGGMLSALATMSPARLTALLATITTAILGAVYTFGVKVGWF
jgi:surface antigen